jgi:3-dehydroquinate synthase
MTLSTPSQNTVRVELGAKSYDIVIGAGILAQAGEYLASLLPSKKVCIVTDETVGKLYLVDFMKTLEKAGFTACPPIILPPGEQTKNFQLLQYMVEKGLSYRLDRHSTFIALGGGVIGDIAGFAAAILMRGIGFVQVPTTLLAQVDSSVGGKTGINTMAGKNLAGAFYQPKAVLIDAAVLKTLPERELKAGYAEVLKYALINDPAFFDWLEKNGKALLSGDAAAQQYAIGASCRAKAAIVEADEDERRDIRALLNLGHTFGHAFEALGGYDGRILHGEAVGAGCLLAFEFSQALGLCPAEDVARLRAHLKDTGLMTEPPFAVTAEEMLARMQGDKKNKDGRLTLILARGIGKAFVSRDADEAALTRFLQERYKQESL